MNDEIKDRFEYAENPCDRCRWELTNASEFPCSHCIHNNVPGNQW